jgi:4-hydroxy-3-methylbut-2-en-1-yl diphosphate synthase IspG/GcpE
LVTDADATNEQVRAFENNSVDVVRAAVESRDTDGRKR